MYLILLQICLLVSVAPQPDMEQEKLENLKAAHASLTDAVRKSDLETIARMVHPSSIGFFRQSQFPVKLDIRHTVRDVLPSLLASLSELVSASPETEYKAYNTTGVVCEKWVVQERIGRSDRNVTRRSTYTYSKLGPRWYLVSWHDSGVVTQ